MDEDSNMSPGEHRLLIDEATTQSAPASPPDKNNSSSVANANNAGQKQEQQFSSANKTTSKMATPTSATKTPLRKGQRITEFIEDKASRIKSYFRRRHVPFKRAFDLDLQCGSRSLLVQVSDDIEECLYFGHDSLVKMFLKPKGLNFGHVNSLIADEKRKLGKYASEDPDILEALGKKRKKSTFKHLEDDDDYSPTAKEKERREREKRKEVQQRVQDGDFLSNLGERTRVFKSRKDSLVTKIAETDSVCATRSFLVVVNLDLEAAFYHGDPKLVAQFFSVGVSGRSLARNINVRQFELDEMDHNVCSVPHCLVTRNFLPRWRLAAMDLFRFPPDIPMTLHICPEADRGRWIAEMDIDPNTNSKISVCSLHFKEGFPTEEFPLPSEFLSDKIEGKPLFSGANAAITDNDKTTVTEDSDSDFDNVKFTRLSAKIEKIREKRRLLMLARRAKRKRRRWIASADANDKKSSALRRKKLALDGVCGSRLQCRFCSFKVVGTKAYFHHVRKVHLGRLCNINDNNKVPEKKNEESALKDQTPPAVPTPKSSKAKRVKLPPVNIAPEEAAALLAMLYPRSRAKSMNPRKKYVCAVCKSPCDLYGLFLHMKKVHQGLLCCFCTKLFKKVGDLENHIKKSHRVPKRYYHSVRQFATYSGAKYNFVCSVCSDIIGIKDLDKHSCKKTTKKAFDCPHCARIFETQSQLDIHLCNGWCKEMKWLKAPTVDDSRKLYKLLTNREADSATVEKMHPTPEPPKPAPGAPKTATPSSASAKPKKKPTVFNVSDRVMLNHYSNLPTKAVNNMTSSDSFAVKDLPNTGSIYHGYRARGINSLLRKELRETGQRWTSLSDQLSASNNPAVDKDLGGLEIVKTGANFFINSHDSYAVDPAATNAAMTPLSPQRPYSSKKPNRRFGPKIPMTQAEAIENKENSFGAAAAIKEPRTSLKISLPMKKETKAERIARMEREIPANFGKIRELLDNFKDSCQFCQQCQVVTVDAIFLLSHCLILHDRQTVVGILGEDPQDSIFRIKTYMKDKKLRDMIFKFADASEPKLDVYHCCYCSDDSSPDFDALFDHLESVHSSKVLTCHLCQNIFLNYGSFRSHVCYGPPGGPGEQLRAKFACLLCSRQDLSTFLDFQFHVRNVHNTCEICFESMSSADGQEALYAHCLTHSQELMCMKCFLTYDDYQAFRKHLFYKHEEESSVCKVCHQKSWPHVYHFCIEPTSNVCEVCDREFADLKKYRVHLRMHTGDSPYVCNARSCKKAFISKQLLLKHHIRRHPELRSAAGQILEERRNKRLMEKIGASSMDSIAVAEDAIDALINLVIPMPDPEPEPEPEEQPMDQNEAKKDEAPEDETSVNKEETETDDVAAAVAAALGEADDSQELDPLNAAIASITGPQGIIDIKKSPVKPASNILSPARPPAPVAIPPPPPLIPMEPKTPEVPTTAIPAVPEPSSPSTETGKEQQDDEQQSEALRLEKERMEEKERAARIPRIDPLKLMYRAHSGKVPLPPRSAILPPSAIKDFVSAPVLNAKSPPTKTTTTTATPEPTPEAEPKSEGETTKVEDAPTPAEATETPTPKEPQKQLDKENPVLGGIWNQDLMFLTDSADAPPEDNDDDGGKMEPVADLEDDDLEPPQMPIMVPLSKPKTKGCKVMKPKYLHDEGNESVSNTSVGIKTNASKIDPVLAAEAAASRGHGRGIKMNGKRDWEVLLSESSGSEDEINPRKVRVREKTLSDRRTALKEHDYCFAAFMAAVQQEEKKEELSEMDKILSNVAMGPGGGEDGIPVKSKKSKKSKKKKKKKKKGKRRQQGGGSSSSSDSEAEVDVMTADNAVSKTVKRTGPKQKYHTPGASTGVAASTARPHFSSSENEDGLSSGDDLDSSDLDTDFSADEMGRDAPKRAAKPTPKAAALPDTQKVFSDNIADEGDDDEVEGLGPSLKLKIKLPSQGQPEKKGRVPSRKTTGKRKVSLPKPPKPPKMPKMSKLKVKKTAFKGLSPAPIINPVGISPAAASNMSKKMRESLALNRPSSSDSDSEMDFSEDDDDVFNGTSGRGYPTSVAAAAPGMGPSHHPVVGVDTKLYCICQSPHDDVSDMIGCDAPDCRLEWFHFECVGIMVPPEGQWYCPECTKRYNIRGTDY